MQADNHVTVTLHRMQAVAPGPQQQVVSALQHAGHSAMAAQVLQAARRTPGWFDRKRENPADPCNFQ